MSHKKCHIHSIKALAKLGQILINFNNLIIFTAESRNDLHRKI